MSRRTTIILLLAVLILPAPGGAQAPDSTMASAQGARGNLDTESQVFLGAFQTILQYHQTTFSDSTLWESALNGLIDGLNDPYATVFTPEDYEAFEEDNTGDYAGIGVQITQLNERVTITAVFRETPAEDVGLIVGDQIVEVKGVDARAWSTLTARDSIRGPVGTSVAIKVAREGVPALLSFSIRRNRVHVSAVTGSMVRDSIGYILVDQVARGSAAEVDSMFNELADAKGIILDLRRNPGGYLVESLSMADLFLDRGKTLARTVSRTPGQPNQTAEESWQANLPAGIPDKSIVVLVDRFTASAAEIVAGSLQDHDRAVVLGERTFGKGVVQTVLPIPGNRRIRITTGDWMTPLGRSLHIPRDRDGWPIRPPEDVIPTVMTEAGRKLRADGGVYPDLVIRGDTLTTVEQNLIIQSAQAEIPLPLRETEFAFEHAQRAAAGTGPAELTTDIIESFYVQLEEEGVPAELMDDEGVRAYLSWRVRMAFAQRADHHAHALEYQAERDLVLAQALELLETTTSQADLLARVEELAKAAAEADEAGAAVGR